MNENEIKIAERFNILDKCQKLEKDFLRLSRITKVEFDLNGLYDNIYQVIMLAGGFLLASGKSQHVMPKKAVADITETVPETGTDEIVAGDEEVPL